MQKCFFMKHHCYSREITRDRVSESILTLNDVGSFVGERAKEKKPDHFRWHTIDWLYLGPVSVQAQRNIHDLTVALKLSFSLFKTLDDDLSFSIANFILSAISG